ncbi:hypothetical protein [Alicyclobacillus ferrooxydans]|nr:hypothetical protein [Alicyclobacillus ferrooxydans]
MFAKNIVETSQSFLDAISQQITEPLFGKQVLSAHFGQTFWAQSPLGLGT